jgi:phosphoribosylcarboxyaminoimidazole (NCAIR) mutase
MRKIETSLAFRQFVASARRTGSIVLHGIAGAGCIMAALAAGMNRNPIISVPMLIAAGACFWRMVAEAKTYPNRI